MQPSKASETWKDAVRTALADLGGTAHLREINEKLKGHPKTRTNPTWKDTIRKVVRQYTIFRPVPPERSGVYELVDEPKVRPGPETADHSSVQGMLLVLGRKYGYETFAPAGDRSRQFQGRPLGEYASVIGCDGFARGPALRSVSQIDAIWLAEDNQGVYPVYAFEVEHTTKVRSGMDRLTEVPERYKAKLFVVGPNGEEERLFQKYASTNRFRRFKDQLFFRDYPQLEALYNAALRHDDIGTGFGVMPRRF